MLLSRGCVHTPVVGVLQESHTAGYRARAKISSLCSYIADRVLETTDSFASVGGTGDHTWGLILARQAL